MDNVYDEGDVVAHDLAQDKLKEVMAKQDWSLAEVRKEWESMFCSTMPEDLVYRVALLEVIGGYHAIADMPKFKDTKELQRNHGPAFIRGYTQVVSIDGEHQAEWEAERAAERYFEEGPHGGFYDDPRGQ